MELSKPHETQTSEYLYVYLIKGKIQISENLLRDHDWLLKHDYQACQNSELKLYQHKDRLKDFVSKFHFTTIEGGAFIPAYLSHKFKFQRLGYYKHDGFLLLNAIRDKKIYSYLIQGSIPQKCQNIASNGDEFDKFLSRNATYLSQIESLTNYGFVPLYSSTDERYKYELYKLTDLSGKRILFYVQTTCCHGNIEVHTFMSEIIARRFIRDYNDYFLCHCC